MSSLTVTVQEVCKQQGDRPDVALSGAAGAVLPAGHKFAAIIVGGYAEMPHVSDASSSSLDPPGPPGPAPASVSRCEVIDAWAFDAAAGKWQSVEYAAGARPPPRIAHQAVVVGEYLYLIAGWHPAAGNEAQFLSDVWRLHLSSWAWEQVTPAGEKLPPISRFQAAAVGDKIYIHHHKQSSSDPHILVLDVSNPQNTTLTKVPVSGDVPASRGLHSVTALPGANKLVLYGGAPQHGPMMSDIYQLDLTCNTWKQMQPQGQQPHARCSHTAGALADGRHVLYAGGAYYKNEETGGGGLQVLDDIFLYDAAEDRWVWPDIPAASKPAARNAAVLLPLHTREKQGVGQQGGGQFLLHGGWIPFVRTFQDTYMLSVQ